MRAVRQVAASCNHEVSTREVIKRVINSKAPEFYVNYERAYRVVSQYLRGNVRNPRTQTAERWACIARRVKTVMDSTPGITYAQALTEVLDHGEAPSFYISHSRATAIYYRRLRHKR